MGNISTTVENFRQNWCEFSLCLFLYWSFRVLTWTILFLRYKVYGNKMLSHFMCKTIFLFLCFFVFSLQVRVCGNAQATLHKTCHPIPNGALDYRPRPLPGPTPLHSFYFNSPHVTVTVIICVLHIEVQSRCCRLTVQLILTLMVTHYELSFIIQFWCLVLQNGNYTIIHTHKKIRCEMLVCQDFTWFLGQYTSMFCVM